MIKLYGFGKSFGVIDASPFVVKVDLFLRITGLEYKSVNDFGHIKQSPKHKLPFIDDRGLKVGDSSEILQYLTNNYNLTLDDFLSVQEKAQAALYSRALDESLYWCIVFSRWVKDDTWPIISQTFFAKMPAPIKWFLPNVIRKDVKKTLYRQGFGRHSEQELLLIADKHFSALSILLADKNYFFGDNICSFDAVLYSHLIQFILVDFDNSFNQQAKQYDNLVKYCQRIKAKYYAD